MRLIRSKADPAFDRIYRAKIDSTWLNSELSDAEVVIEEFAVIKTRGDVVTLDRPSPATAGLTTISARQLGVEFMSTMDNAMRVLYRRFCDKVESVYSNDDVINGRISEHAAILGGLN